MARRSRYKPMPERLRMEMEVIDKQISDKEEELNELKQMRADLQMAIDMLSKSRTQPKEKESKKEKELIQAGKKI